MEEGLVSLVLIVIVVLVTLIFMEMRLRGRRGQVLVLLVLVLLLIKRNLVPRTNLLIPYDSRELAYFLDQFSSFSDAPEDEYEVEAAGRGGEWGGGRGLEYDFYRNSCPQAERIVQAVVRDMYRVRASVAPALVRLLFHDCFIEGCDASVLLDPAEGMGSEKDSPPNDGLKGFDVIDVIKSQLEVTCPRIISCADMVALAGREGIVEAGGPFYPLLTGRRDSLSAYQEMATKEIPSPDADLPHTLAAFASKEFDERETVSLLGARGIGMIHCKFLENRLYNFRGTSKPDPSMDAAFLTLLQASCKNTSTEAPASSPPSASSSSAPSSPAPSNPSCHPSMSPSSPAPSDPSYRPSMSPSPFAASAPYRSRTSPSVALSFGGAPSLLFDIKTENPADPPPPAPSLYYRRLLQRKGNLYSDQQLLAEEQTGTWVRAYAVDPSLFRKDFALAMMKLSHLRVLTGSEGQVRRKCSKVL